MFALAVMVTMFVRIVGRSAAFVPGLPRMNYLRGALKNAVTGRPRPNMGSPILHGRTLALSPMNDDPEPMQNIYSEWSVEDDRLLYENRDKSTSALASMFGRGLQGVRRRLSKLKDINSAAYARLFIGDDDDEAAESGSDKLVPAVEVLRRVRWDMTLSQKDFVVCYYDRVEDSVEEVPFDAENNSVKGEERMLVFAIPEHRITAIKYKERTVWDKDQRLDCVFGSMQGKGMTIDRIIEDYDQWKEEKEQEKELGRLRLADVTARIKSRIGDGRFAILKESSSRLKNPEGSRMATDELIKEYVGRAMNLFEQVEEESNATNDTSPGKDVNPGPSRMHQVENLHLLSELVALLPYNYILRERILMNIESKTDRLEGRSRTVSTRQVVDLPELIEDDLRETFVRGSGAGGQKINKTSNRVILLHTPTDCRVECQETRTLQQNRKIARKRLRLKVDEYINGDYSRMATKNSKAVRKKAKNKARNRSRQRKKREGAATDANQAGES